MWGNTLKQAMWEKSLEPVNLKNLDPTSPDEIASVLNSSQDVEQEQEKAYLYKMVRKSWKDYIKDPSDDQHISWLSERLHSAFEMKMSNEEIISWLLSPKPWEIPLNETEKQALKDVNFLWLAQDLPKKFGIMGVLQHWNSQEIPLEAIKNVDIFISNLEILENSLNYTLWLGMTNKEIGVRLSLLFLQRKIEDFAKKLEENNLFDLLEFLNIAPLKKEIKTFEVREGNENLEKKLNMICLLERKIAYFTEKLEENNLFDLLEFLNRDMLKEQMEIFQKTDFHKLLRALADKKQSIRFQKWFKQ